MENNSFFHKVAKANKLPLGLPKLEINNTTIERQPTLYRVSRGYY